MPDPLLGLSTLEPYVGWFTVLGLACICLLIGISVVESVNRWLQVWRLRTTWNSRLKKLTEDEKAVLRKYVANNVRTQHLSFSNGVANGLEAKQVLYRASSLGMHGDYFAYNIQDCAYSILERHPEYLSPN